MIFNGSPVAHGIGSFAMTKEVKCLNQLVSDGEVYDVPFAGEIIPTSEIDEIRDVIFGCPPPFADLPHLQ
jgi:hypothetical protein